MRNPKPKMVKVIKHTNGTAFGIDTKGNLWEMENGCIDAPYRIAVAAEEVTTIIGDMEHYAKQREPQKQIDELERQIAAFRAELSADGRRFLSPTASGYDIRHWNDGSLSVGCVTLNPEALKPVLALIKKSAKRR